MPMCRSEDKDALQNCPKEEGLDNMDRMMEENVMDEKWEKEYIRIIKIRILQKMYCPVMREEWK